MRITAVNIVSTIDQLPKARAYNYINPRTSTVVQVVRPEGPIYIKRCNPRRG